MGGGGRFFLARVLYTMLEKKQILVMVFFFFLISLQNIIVADSISGINDKFYQHIFPSIILIFSGNVLYKEGCKIAQLSQKFHAKKLTMPRY